MNDRLVNKSERRWTRRKEARPEEITAAALDLFVERGFANTRLEDVASRAGISKGTLYLYFANKEELFKAVVREGLVTPLVEIRDMVERFEGSSMELLRLMFDGWWQRIGATPLSGIPKLMISEARNFPELARFYVEEVVEPGQHTLAQIIERGIKSGEFRPVDSHDVARLITAPMLMMMLWRNSLACCAPGSREIDPMAMVQTHLDIVGRGLAADRRQTSGPS